MAELFSTFAQFKAHVGGGISTSLELSSLAPVIADTAQRHLVPYLGADVYADLVDVWENNSANSQEEDLILKIQRPLALLTMYEYSKIGGIEFSEGGMHRNESDTRKSAYRYQEKQYSTYMLEKGYDALEEMLIFLEDHIGTYSDWAATEEAMAHLSPLLNYARDFRFLGNMQCDRYTFECLKPIIAEIESFGVQALLPQAFWTYYQGQHIDDDLTPEEVILRGRIRKAIVHKTLEEAQRQQWIQVLGGRVFLTEEFGEQSQVNKTSPTNSPAALHSIAHNVWADRHTSYWKKYICDNPEDFPLVFDEASGGDNTDADAWHINTDEENAAADVAETARLQKPVVWL